jgi:ABC-type oligopeptide transport system substrate-binding subunit
MIRKPVLLLLALTLGAATLAACGSSGGSASKASKAAFCRDNTKLSSSTQKATSLADIVKIFKANVATIDDFGKTAPADIAADAKKLVDAAHKVISTGDTKAFSDTATSDAGKRVDTYCGKSTTTTT